jgi:hypothetical protein
MRNHIIKEIQRIAKRNDGRPPGIEVFEREAAIGRHVWLGKFWARWGDALIEAGFAPNELQQKFDSNALLQKIADAVRHYNRIPSAPEMMLYRRLDPAFPNPKTISLHYRKPEMVEALRAWVTLHADYADVTTMLPAQSSVAVPSSNRVDGFVYLIRSGAHYKIGRSDELERRVKEIRVALPDRATLEHSIRTDDPVGIESYWHRRFAEKRANGEWFKLDRADVAAFKRRKFQ